LSLVLPKGLFWFVRAVESLLSTSCVTALLQ
jgi:hypothetical protein